MSYHQESASSVKQKQIIDHEWKVFQVMLLHTQAEDTTAALTQVTRQSQATNHLPTFLLVRVMQQ